MRRPQPHAVIEAASKLVKNLQGMGVTEVEFGVGDQTIGKAQIPPITNPQAPAVAELMTEPVTGDDAPAEDQALESAAEPEKPEIVMLPSLVNVTVEDGYPRVYCAYTGRQFAGWSDIKTDMKKGAVRLVLNVDFDTIETIKPPKDDKQIEMFPAPDTIEPAPTSEPVVGEPKPAEA